MVFKKKIRLINLNLIIFFKNIIPVYSILGQVDKLLKKC